MTRTKFELASPSPNSSYFLPTEVGRAMFTLPALLYLKLLPLFGQCLYHLIMPNKSRPPHAGGGLPTGPLPALHPFWVGRAIVGIFLHHTSGRTKRL
ncbi:hypothetical protein AVEN_133474-1 [Araneus ventricosus]|uniref:Uncharacterized protein n=1 Tax=Araneus ventricosus TaxID=182803 RepID=A0A4Y2K9Q8_ARAVE|nr:hypothetical protein AVEN_133474-1 [Araneus ventricosus]